MDGSAKYHVQNEWHDNFIQRSVSQITNFEKWQKGVQHVIEKTRNKFFAFEYLY